MTTLTPTLTILAVPKGFHGNIAVIQRNAIASGTNVHPRPDIRLYGTEDGIAEAASSLSVRHETEIARNEFGTPMLDDLLARARQFTQTSPSNAISFPFHTRERKIPYAPSSS